MTLPAYTRNMTQTATYWSPSGTDTFGQTTYAAPTQIKCRWQNKRELFRDADGNEVTSTAVVYPDQELALRGKLQQGTVTGSPTTAAREIRQVGDSPDLSGQKTLNKVWL